MLNVAKNMGYIAVGLMAARMMYTEIQRGQMSALNMQLKNLMTMQEQLQLRLLNAQGKDADQERYYAEDFARVFNVEPMHNITLADHLKPLQSQWDVTKDDRYVNGMNDVLSNLDLYGPYLDSLEAPDRRMYIQWAGEQYGYGMFANVNLKAHTFLAVYGGILTDNKLNTDYMWNYATPVTIGNKTYEFGIDGRFTGNLMRFSNHDDNPNVGTIFVAKNNLWHLCYITTEPIMKGEQIFVSYGASYWKDRVKARGRLEGDSEREVSVEA
jgi:hypothetical protein